MTEFSTSKLPEYHILEQAAKWFTTISVGSVSDDDTSQWQHWLETHPKHQRAWQYVEQVGHLFQETRQATNKAPNKEVAKASW